MYDANPGGYPGRDGAVVVVGLRQAYYEVGMILDPWCLRVSMILDSAMHVFLILIYVMHKCMMHSSMILDPDTRMYDAYIFVPQSLTLMHVCMVHVFLILIHVAMMHIYVRCIYP